ncbi:hypothetical protein FH972_014821 [Carpinus fangiana]|uniref:C-terminal processing peptidase n=1 Tax=Carpinus fangiana TaxID=176857 RepID=A0A5N6RCQ8_9ROSI|nr:hypothetical protein FH972_014821 [Carpinus fangiana]
MVVLASSSTASLSPHFAISNVFYNNPYWSSNASTPQVLPWKSSPTRIVEARLWSPLMCRRINATNVQRNRGNTDEASKHNLLVQSMRFNKILSLKCDFLSITHGRLLKFGIYFRGLPKVIYCLEKFRQHVSIPSVCLIAGVMLVMSVSVSVSRSPSWALTEENLLFLEAWRTIDRAYVDKTFNGQSWFRYRENALRNEPMNTREQTYMAIKKMLATLDDPFTRFLEPEKFKSLRSGTQGALTGVGLSIGYPSQFDGSAAGLLVISAAPGGPANRAGILTGDVIVAIDDTSTETMGIYDAAERLQ